MKTKSDSQVQVNERCLKLEHKCDTCRALVKYYLRSKNSKSRIILMIERYLKVHEEASPEDIANIFNYPVELIKLLLFKIKEVK